jgi:hypothetical protein
MDAAANVKVARGFFVRILFAGRVWPAEIAA